MEELTTRTVCVPRGRPNEVSSHTTTKSRAANCRLTPARCPRFPTPPDWSRSTDAKEAQMHKLKAIYEWLELRLQLEAPVKDAVLHPVPRNTASWWYVFGSAAFTLLLLQIATGILLAIVYVPSAAHA